MKQEIHMASLYLSLYIWLINCKRKTKERADRHHLHEVIKLLITDNGTNWYHVPLENAKENILHHPHGIFAQYVYLSLWRGNSQVQIVGQSTRQVKRKEIDALF